MSSKTKILLLLMVLMLPYMAIMVPTLMRYQEGGVPTWIPLVGGFYMLFTIVTVTLFSQRLAKKQAGSLPPNPDIAARANNRGMALIVFWVLLFLYGVAKVWSGAIPLNRGIPAGILLLSFIGVFSYFAYRDKQNRAR
jgi:hypothetical protein